MFIVTNRIAVTPGWEEAFEERFRSRIGQVEKNPGFERMHVLRPLSDDAPYVIYTVWRDREAYHDWVNSDDFRRDHENPLPQPAFSGKPVLEYFEVALETVGR